MRTLIRRVAAVAGAAMVLLGLAVGSASASPGSAVLTWSPTTSTGTYNYGTVFVPQTASQTFTLVNSGSTQTSWLSITVSGSPTFTNIVDTCTGAKLKPDQACYVVIQYAPVPGGQNVSATLTAAATSSKPATTASLTLAGASADVVNPGNQTSTAGTPVSLQIAASDSAAGQTLTYSATGLPPGLSINPATGAITGVFTSLGNFTVTVTVTDASGASGSTTFVWQVIIV